MSDTVYKGADSYMIHAVTIMDQIDLDKGIAPPTEEAKLLARALANLMPGHFVYPSTDSRHEGIPYFLNSLYDAERLLEEVERIKNEK